MKSAGDLNDPVRARGKWQREILAASLLLVGLAGGYCLRVWQVPEVASARSEVKLALDDFVSVESFSEIENAKGVLQGLSTQFITELRTREYLSGGFKPSEAGADQDQRAEFVRDLQRGIEQFKGTEQELLLVRELLWTLKMQRRLEEWLQVYLRAVYEHPSDRLVSVFASSALDIARTSGREKDLLHAFEHLTRIPFEFEVKQRIQSLVQDMDNASPFTLNIIPDGHQVAHVY